MPLSFHTTNPKTMAQQLAALLGGALATSIVVLTAIFLLWLCRFHRRTLSRGNSDTGSSEPYGPGVVRGGGASVGDQTRRKVRELSLEQIGEATKGFEEGSVMGNGRFGIVYKGLLYDGTVVAIKRRSGAPREDFALQVARLSEIHHPNVVCLLGFCQEGGFQALAFEYLPNGSICNHLYNSRQGKCAKIEFKQRVSIALGIAKGLCHLHGLNPPVVHKNFKTANVLVDENFIAKVSDAGLVDLLNIIEVAHPSSGSSSFDVFHDPWADEFESLSKQNDVYSYGIFLLELMIGREASSLDPSYLGKNISEWVDRGSRLEDLIDDRLHGTFTDEGLKGMIELVQECTISPPKGQRPVMEGIVGKLEDILEKEIGFTTGIDSTTTTTVMLGSQLFTC